MVNNLYFDLICCHFVLIETPLTIAVTSDDRHDLIVMLVNGGAHLDYRAGDGLTPMHKAALAGKAGNVKVCFVIKSSISQPIIYIYIIYLQNLNPHTTDSISKSCSKSTNQSVN